VTQAAVGTTIGAYRIVRAIGEGGWSTVYEVEAPGGQRLALKRLRDGLAPEALARFRREVESLRRLDHPGVLRLLDAGLDGAAPYLVTPLVHGTSVRALMSRSALGVDERSETRGVGSLGVEGAVSIAIAAADGVAAIHAGGLVHRDLKPENLMVGADGQVVVIDLGLALGPEHSRHTSEHALTGSVPYMSPEQIDDRAPSAASDVWALGVILYEAIAGRRPFERARQSEEVAAILGGRCAPLADVAPACPPELSRLIASCLAAAPAQRPVDGAALAAALVRLVDWTAPARLGEARALMVADPARHAAWIRELRVELVRGDVERALAAGDAFAASRALDRGLVTAPDDPRMRALVDRVMAASSAASGQELGRSTVRGYAAAPPPARTRVVAIASVPSASVAAPRRARWPWLVGGTLAAGGLIAAIAIGARGGDDHPAAVISPPAPAITVDAASPASRPAHVLPSKPASEVAP